MKQTFLKTILLLCITIVFTNCDKEEITTEQQINIETVSITEAQNLFSIDEFSKNSKSKKETYTIPNLDFISHEEITGSDELLTIIPAYTNYQNVYSRILLLKIDGSIESVIFSMVRDENSSTEQFSGKLYITDLDGNYINAFRVVDDVLVSRFLKPTSTESKSSKSLTTSKGEGDEEDCWGIACGMEGEEVVIIANKPSVNNTPLTILDFRGYGGGNGSTWDPWPGSGGSSGSTGCSDGYVKDSNGNCVAPVVVVAPDDPITDIQDFLKCFDTTQSATFTIYSNEPDPGTGETYELTLTGAVVGHTYISITQGNNTSVFGFYPAADDYTNSNSALGNDSNEQFSASLTKTISGTQLQQIINSSINFNATYDLNTYNCTDFAIDMANLSGLNSPNCNGTWPGSASGGSSNPGTLGMEIRNRTLQSGETRNIGSGNAPNTNQGC